MASVFEAGFLMLSHNPLTHRFPKAKVDDAAIVRRRFMQTFLVQIAFQVMGC